MPDCGNLTERASANTMGVLMVLVLSAGVLAGEAARHPVAAPTIAPISSGRDYGQDVTKSDDFLQQSGTWSTWWRLRCGSPWATRR